MGEGDDVGPGVRWDDEDNIIPFRASAPLALDEERAGMVPDDDAPAANAAEITQDDGPLPGVADPADWRDREAPERRFIIPGWLVRGHAGLLSGMEGVGKSLIAQQMLTCIAIGRTFLGLDIVQVNAVYITCEDSIEELWRRQEAINRSLGITMDDISGKLLLVSLCGELGNELGTFDSESRLTPSKRYRQIEKLCLDFGAGLVVLDNAAHLFPGNENARHDVAAFLGLVERLSQAMDGAALLLAHPNKQHSQGNKQGNEYSGSTGWSAHVRNRLFLDYAADTEDGTPVDDDARVLRKSKANYGRRGEEITFRWHDWAFVRTEELPGRDDAETAANIAASHDNAVFMRCLAERTRQHRAVSERLSKSYAPAVFAAMPEARGVTKQRLESAMDRLFRTGEIERAELWKGPDRKAVFGLQAVREMSLHENANSLKSFAGNVAGNGAGNVAGNAVNGRRGTQSTHTPSTTYIGDPLEGPPSMYDGEPPEWMDQAPHDDADEWRSNPALNPDWRAE